MADKSRKSGGARKHGRQKRKPAHMRYNNTDRCYKNKLKRVLKSSGSKAAAEYRKEHFRQIRAGD